MALLKICPKCNKIIQYNNSYCTKCEQEVIEQKRESYKEYKRNRKDIKEQKFYSSKGWINLREDVLRMYLHIDLWSYYVDNKIVEANTVHHILETKEDWNLRLDKDNLICLSKETHKQIHNLYNKNSKAKQEVQELLRKMNRKFREEFGL